MQQVCQYSTVNKLGQVQCMADNYNQPCTFQKYCRKDNTWKLTDDFLTCERKEKEMNKKANNYSQEKFSETKKVVENYITPEENPTSIIEVKNKKGKVILVCDNFIIVEDENGNGITLYNIEAKDGEIIEF